MTAIKIHALPHPDVKERTNLPLRAALICGVYVLAGFLLDDYVSRDFKTIMGFWGMTAVFAIPLGLILLLFGKREAKTIAQERTLESVARYSDTPILYYGRGDDGKLLAVSEKAVFMQRPRGRIAEVPYSKIRNIHWEIQGYTQTLFPGLVSAAANNVRKHEARMNSGLFIDIADIDEPHWHLVTSDERMLRKWKEFFEQAFERINVQDDPPPVARTGT